MKIIGLFAMTIAFQSWAVVQGFYLRNMELRDIVDNTEVRSALMQVGFIDSIQYRGTQGNIKNFRVVSNTKTLGVCEIPIEVTYDTPPPPFVGPGKRIVTVRSRICERD